jgi:hypothetical protein
VGFEVLMMVKMKISVFWDVMLCSLVERWQHFQELAASIFRIDTETEGRSFF